MYIYICIYVLIFVMTFETLIFGAQKNLEDLGLGGYNFFRSFSTHRSCFLVRKLHGALSCFRWEEWT